jgi:uncharacterized protein (TIGR02145 family)
MKTTFKYAILAAILLTGASGCSEEENLPDSNEFKAVMVKVTFAYVQEATVRGAIPQVNDLKVFFIGDGIIKKVGDITAAEIAESSATKAFMDVPGSATDVIIIANAGALGSPNLSGIVEGAPVEELGKIAFVQNVQTNPVSAVNLYGAGTITGSSPGFTAFVFVTPVVSCIKIGKIEAIAEDSQDNIALSGFKLTGIYINNTYTELGADYETVPSEAAKVISYSAEATKWIDGAYPIRFCDEFFDVAAATSFAPAADTDWSYYILPAKADNGATINGKRQSSVPHIVLKIEGAVSKAGQTLPSPAYVTVREIKVNGEALSQFERGRVYSISSLAIGGQHLASKPESNAAANISAEATVAGWNEEKAGGGQGQSPGSTVSTANSYIIAPGAADFRIPLLRANLDGISRIGLTDQISAELVWTDVANPLTSGSAIESIGVQGVGSAGYLTVSTGSAEGNAVIAIKVGAEIKWSWHVWVTNYVPSGEPGTFMDRNLGALSNNRNDNGGVNALGLLYQWGRKDPFPGSSGVSSDSESAIYNAGGAISGVLKENAPSGPNLEVSIANPLTFYYSTGGNYDWYASGTGVRSNYLWNSVEDRKTPYDPCPTGWKIPTMSDWDLLTIDNFLPQSNVPKGRTGARHGGWYPAAGYRNHDNGNLSHVGVEGQYWNSSPFGTKARILYFYSNFLLPGNTNHRACGFPVRCIREW